MPVRTEFSGGTLRSRSLRARGLTFRPVLRGRDAARSRRQGGPAGDGGASAAGGTPPISAEKLTSRAPRRARHREPQAPGDSRGERPMLKYVIVWLLLFAMMTVSLTFFFGPIVLLYLAAVLILHRRGTTAAERTSIPHEGVHTGNARRSRHHWRGVLEAKAGCRSRRHHGHTRRDECSGRDCWPSLQRPKRGHNSIIYSSCSS